MSFIFFDFNFHFFILYYLCFPTRRSSDLCPGWCWSSTGSSNAMARPTSSRWRWPPSRSEEHTSELQSRGHHVCRLLHDKKNTLTCYNGGIVEGWLTCTACKL